MAYENRTTIEYKLEKLREECRRCVAPGDNPCRWCETNIEKNELRKQLGKI